MNKRNKTKNLILILMLIAALCSASFISVFAVTQEEKDAAEKAAKEAAEQAEAKKKEAKETAKKRAAAVANIDEAEKKLEQIQGEMDSTKGEIESTEASIVSTEEDIAVTQTKIEETLKKIQKKEAEIEEQNKALGNRLTAMYKTGSAGIFDVVLSSESVEGLLSNWGMVHRILESDQNLLKKLQDDYKELAAIKAELQEINEQLEGKVTYLESQKVNLQEQQLRLEGQQAETEEIKKKYKEEADKLHAMQKQKEAEAAQMAAEAAAMQAEAERMIVETGGNIEVTPGQYQWPTASNWTQTSNYGWRRCPFHGREFHTGVDIVLTSGTYGAPVYAIADGVVTRASYYGSYGNCVTYAIGGGYSVLYGHLKGYNCKKDQVVKKGDVLGYIGSTGASTGPHLHFTVFKDGELINPYSLY